MNRANKRLLLAALSLCLSAGLRAAPVAELVRGGQIVAAYEGIQPAIDAAQPGDTVRIQPGVHHENVIISGRSGADGQPIVIEGAAPEGVILDGADPGLQQTPNQRWTSLGEGVWKATVPWRGEPDRANLTWVTPAAGPIFPAYHLEKNFQDLRRGPGTWRQGNDLLIKFADTTDPNQLSLSAGVAEAVILFENSSHWIVRNLELRHAGNTNLSIGDGCSHITVDHVTSRDAWRGLSTNEYPAKVSHITVTHCTVINRWSGTWNWVEAYGDAGQANDDYNAPMRGTGIHVDATGAEVAFNRVEGCWDGLGMRGVDLSVHDNTISSCQDDGVELESGHSANVRFFNNVIYNVHVGISTVANQPGPIYIYRNRVSSNNLIPSDPEHGRAFRFGYALKMGQDWGIGARRVYIYQNSFFSKRLSLWDKETTPWHDFQFLNNIFVSEGVLNTEGLREQFQVWNTGLADNGVVWNGNIFFRPGGGGQLFRSWNGQPKVATLAQARDLFPAWETSGLEVDPGLARLDTAVGAPNEFQISAASPARDRAVPLPGDWPDSVRASDGKPDVGAVEFESPDLAVQKP